MDSMIERHTMDKRAWPKGAWSKEPDWIQFRHAGITCVMRRNELGAWCGYIAVPEGHPWRDRGLAESDAEVHGGITYGGIARGFDGGNWLWIEGSQETHYFVGFDCSQAEDFCPNVSSYDGDVYRDKDYAIAETMKLAEQARSKSASSMYATSVRRECESASCGQKEGA